jgi:Tfp pilus assembly protein PilF
MARKRLNKKVALIGTVVFVFLVLAAIGVILRLSQDPEKFIKDGDAAMKAAQEAVDEQVRTEEYNRAARNYSKARGMAKTDSLRVEMLFKLADIYLKTDRWRNVRGCWNKIIQIEPKNTKARFGQLKLYYIVANNGARGYWQEVASQASEFIEVADANLLAEETTKWESFGTPVKERVAEYMGSYLYLLRGRAVLEMTKMGAVTDPDDSLAQATDDLEKVREIEPDNPQAYFYLAQAVIAKGEILTSRGNFEERDKARKQAEELLEQAVEVAETDPRAHINLLTMKLMLAQEGGREEIQTLEPEYLSLVERFDSSAEAFSALTGLYLQLDYKYLDKAIEAIEKAIELDRGNVAYAMVAANLHYHKSSVYGQKEEIYKAIELARNALALPNAQDRPGPWEEASRRYRISLYVFLANCYIEQVLEAREAGTETEPENQQWLKYAEDTVHQIEQHFGSGENVSVVKWQGMLELAKGNRNIAIRKMYAAYEQLKAASKQLALERVDSLLSYRLAKVFENTAELGAVNEFYTVALRLSDRNAPDKIDERKPEALLDYADVLLKLRAYNGVLSIVDFFENEYWSNERSRTLRIKAQIAAMQFDEAEEELAKIEPNDPNRIKLNLVLVQTKIEQVRMAIRRKQIEAGQAGLLGLGAQKDTAEGTDELMTAELKGYSDALVELVEELLPIEPNAVEEASIFAVCNNYVAEDQTSKAEELINRFLQYFPDNTTALFYKQALSEPEPDKISQQRRTEIEEQVLSGIADPVRRAVNLGLFYQRNNEPNEAVKEFKNVLGTRLVADDEITPAEEPSLVEAKAKDEEITDLQRLAVGYLFDMALGAEDLELAEQLVGLTRRENVDECSGNFFAARLAVAKEEYRDALLNIDECLRQRPVFSLGFMLRSNINAALGNEHTSIEDARKAASLNPRNGAIAKELWSVLHQRNLKLGDNVSSDQAIETRAALDRAMALNPGDLELLSLYAEYIISTDPLRALAIRQNLQKIAPSVQNALLLGRLATRMARAETDAERKEALFDIAASSFEQAREIDPDDKAVLSNYAAYYRAKGEDEKAEQLLVESQSPRLLWRHHFQASRQGPLIWRL